MLSIKSRVYLGTRQLCRTCLLRCADDDMTSVFALEPTLKVPYHDIIEAVTRVDISQDAYTTYICSTCQSAAASAYRYKLMVMEVDQKLGTCAVYKNIKDAACLQDDKSTIKQEVCVGNVVEVNMKQEYDRFEGDDVSVHFSSSPVHNSDDDIKVELKIERMEDTHQVDIPVELFDSTPSLEKLSGQCTEGVAEKQILSKWALYARYINKREMTKVTSKATRKKMAEIRKREKLKNLMFIHRRGSYPRCGVCSCVCMTEEKLIEHYSIHYDARVTQCTLCNKLFSEAQHLRRHLAVAHKQRQADVAPFTFISSLVDDIVESAQEVYMSVCPRCGELTMTSEALEQHNSTEHADYTIVCQFCNKIFLNQSEMKVHNRPCHRRFKHTCAICKEKFMYRTTMNSHMSDKHGGDPVLEEIKRTCELKCKFCDKILTTNQNRIAHEGTHGREKQLFECDICHKIINNKMSLISHMKKHNVTKKGPKSNALCSVCGESVPSLYVHMQRKHATLQLKCKLCSKEFFRQDALKMHLRVHTGERPYKCEYCDKKFARASALMRHKRIHTGERPYQCKHCDRKFTQSQDKHRHELRHTGEKPYYCGCCGEGFHKAKDLQKHQEDCLYKLLPAVP